jgi:hypothetical protein
LELGEVELLELQDHWSEKRAKPIGMAKNFPKFENLISIPSWNKNASIKSVFQGLFIPEIALGAVILRLIKEIKKAQEPLKNPPKLGKIGILSRIRG